jgi:teichuronic acid biosynthesis glycosyltransferase TuaC
MLRVLTLSTLFPNAARPTLGVFVERQTLGLAALPDVEVQVVSPVGLPPWPLRMHPHYRSLARLPEQESWKGLEVYRPRYRVLPGLGQGSTPRRLARALLPVLRKIRRDFPFDVIDAEFFWPDGPAAMHLARALGVRVSIKARGSDIRYWGEKPAIAAQMVEAAEAASGLLAVSEPLKRDMVALGMPAEKIMVHYTGVDTAAFRPSDRAAEKAALGIAGPLILSVGALVPRKEQRLAIAALEALPQATLVLVGDGPEKAALEREAARRRLTDRVRFLGNRPHAELPRLLAAADVLLHPSSSEGLANVWLEALACGIPVVCQDVGGAREVVRTPAAGRIVPGDPAAMAAAVRELLAKPSEPGLLRESISAFTWERNAETLRAHLAGLST